MKCRPVSRGPPRPWETKSKRGSSRILNGRMGRSRLPTDLVRLEKRLGVVAQRLADLEHRPGVPRLLQHDVAHRLIQVRPPAADVRDALECCQRYASWITSSIS